MKSALRFLSATALLLALASCSNDPVSPGSSGHFTSEYRPTLLSMEGRFTSICGTDKDVYAIGRAILHFDGSRWNTVEPPHSPYGDFQSAMTFPDGRLVISGPSTFVLDHGQWTDISDQSSYGYKIWGTAPDNLYKVSYRELRHFDGTAWSTVALPEGTNFLYDLAGRTNNDIAVSAEYGKLLRFDGSQWTTTLVDSFNSYGSLAFTSSGRLYAATYREVYEITGATRHLVLRSFIEAPILYADGEVLYLAGVFSLDRRYFVIARLENGLWDNVAADSGRINSLWAQDGNVIAGGEDNFIWRGTSAGGVVDTPCPSRGGFNCVSAIDGALFVGGDKIFRYEDGTWTDLNKEEVTRDQVYDMAGLRRDDVYMVGRNMLLHYDGSSWTWINSGVIGSPRSVWVDRNSDVWVASYNATFRLHGGAWSVEDIAFDGRSVLDMWGDDEVMVAVGRSGTASMRRNGVWRAIPTGSTHDLVAVWGSNQDHVYAADYDDNQILMYNGRGWETTKIDAISDHYMISLWGTGAANVFATGSDGSIVHFDGNSWQPLPRVFAGDAVLVSGTPREVLTVGYAGAVSYRR